ncbi:MAG: hypothetical protein HKN63_06570 [Rhodobacteraceae bacterium]|nr:hypothetical protein [Paracoccaceae bacterium]
MFSRLAGAVLRAILVVLLVATPSLLLPNTTSDTAQIISLVALFGACLTVVEYSSTYPGLVEFRDAPPFNRIRFASLFVTVLLLSIICRGVYAPNTLTYLVESVGALIGHVIDFPYSPVRLVVLMLPEDISVEHITLVRSAAGLSYLVSLLTLGIFLIILRLKGWPQRSARFNVWINLPTFDPTAGGDVVERLERDARFNIALGFLLPFLVPAVLKAASSLFGAVSLENPQTLIWTVSAWAFLPASLFLRGIAMQRIATMIEDKRRAAMVVADANGDMLPA